jgi:hypothetical protein
LFITGDIISLGELTVVLACLYGLLLSPLFEIPVVLFGVLHLPFETKLITYNTSFRFL